MDFARIANTGPIDIKLPLYYIR